MRTHGSRTLRKLVLLAAAALVAAAAPAAPAAAAGLGGFSLRPATFNSRNPATRAYFIEQVRPGSEVSGQVVLDVSGPAPMDFRVYPVDGVTAVTSGAVYRDRQDRLRGAGAWLQPQVHSVHAAPHSQRLITFRLIVPLHARPGDHLAGLAVEDAHPLHSGGRFSITQVLRGVVGVEVQVPGPTHTQIALRRLALQPIPGTRIPAIAVTLANIGQKLCKPALSVSLRGAGGAQTVARRLDTVLPGDTIAFPLAWPRPLGTGEYRMAATASGCGLTSALRATQRLGQALRGTAAAPDPPPPPTAASRHAFPWSLVLVAGAGLLLGLGMSRLRPGRSGIQRPIG